MQKICMILDKPFPPDISVEKEARFLFKSGYETHLVCIEGKNKSEFTENIRVHRLSFDRSSLLKRILNAKYPFNFFYIRTWCKKILNLNKKERFCAFHAHDLTTMPFTLLAGKIAGVPVVFDMHEDFTAMQYSGMDQKSKLSKIISFSLGKIMWTIWERISIVLSSRIIVVVKEEIARVRKLGASLEKIEVVLNTADFSELETLDTSLSFNEFNNKFLLCYVGGFSCHRGLDTLVKAMPLILEKIPAVHLVLVGDGVMREPLLKICDDLILKAVSFTGWVSFKEAMDYIRASDLCVIPYLKTRQTEKSFPHKLGQYMYYQKPILTSDVKSLKRIIQETKCGIIFKSGDHLDLARKVIEAKEKKILPILGENGRRAAEKIQLVT